MNITSMAMQFLGPAIINKLATSFGVPPSMATKIASAIVPTLLAGMVSKASKPEGAKALTDILGKVDTGMLGKFGDLIGGPKQASVVEQGTGLLGSLLGTGTLGSLVGAAAKYAGTGEGPTKGLIGMLAPAVLGTVAQQSKGLDAGGLAKMLMGQKDTIAAAIPGDFAKMLGGTGLLDSVMPATTSAAPAPRPTSATTATASVSDPAMSKGPASSRASVHSFWRSIRAASIRATSSSTCKRPRPSRFMPPRPRLRAER